MVLMLVDIVINFWWKCISVFINEFKRFGFGKRWLFKELFWYLVVVLLIWCIFLGLWGFSIGWCGRYYIWGVGFDNFFLDSFLIYFFWRLLFMVWLYLVFSFGLFFRCFFSKCKCFFVIVLLFGKLVFEFF